MGTIGLFPMSSEVLKTRRPVSCVVGLRPAWEGEISRAGFDLEKKRGAPIWVKQKTTTQKTSSTRQNARLTHPDNNIKKSRPVVGQWAAARCGGRRSVTGQSSEKKSYELSQRIGLVFQTFNLTERTLQKRRDGGGVTPRLKKRQRAGPGSDLSIEKCLRPGKNSRPNTHFFSLKAIRPELTSNTGQEDQPPIPTSGKQLMRTARKPWHGEMLATNRCSTNCNYVPYSPLWTHGKWISNDPWLGTMDQWIN